MTKLLKQKPNDAGRIRDLHLFREQAFIAGTWVDGPLDDRIEVVDPATQTTIGTVPDMDRSQVDRAIEAAKTAASHWRGCRHMRGPKRCTIGRT